MSRPVDTTPVDAYRGLFYGIPVECIADWLDCSLSHAKALKAGRARPSAAVAKLFKLHLDGRVLTDEWAGWGVRRGALCDPEGHEMTQAQLRAYPFVWQLAHEYGRQNDLARGELARIVTRIVKAAGPANPSQRQQRRMAEPAAITARTTDPSTQNPKPSVSGAGAGPGSRHEPPLQQTPRAAQPPSREAASDLAVEAYNRWLDRMGFVRTKCA